MLSATIKAFSSELMKLAVSSLTQDALAGVDPFGNWTSQYGQQAQQAGLSERQHRIKRLVGTAGGLAGGAVAVPTAISGLIGAAQGASTGSGRARLVGAGRGFISGAKAPIQAVYHGGKGSRFLSRTAKGTKAVAPSKSQTKSLKFIKDRVTLGKLPKIAPARSRENLGKALRAAESAHFDRAVTPDVARALQAPVQSAYVQGLSQLGLGGAIGGTGAYVQYGKGRKAEKEFQKRLKSR